MLASSLVCHYANADSHRLTQYCLVRHGLMKSSDSNFLDLSPSRTKRFPSEALLQQAIAGLLTRMPDTSGVQILQGSQEFGKDLIFYHRGGFDEQTLCACVVKNTKITGD